MPLDEIFKHASVHRKRALRIRANFRTFVVFLVKVRQHGKVAIARC